MTDNEKLGLVAAVTAGSDRRRYFDGADETLLVLVKAAAGMIAAMAEDEIRLRQALNEAEHGRRRRRLAIV
jgi:hypothetical protein